MTPHPAKQPGDLRILFWNIRDWGHHSTTRHFNRILATLRREKPDIALFAEIMNPTIKTQLAQRLPGPHIIFETTDKNPRRLLAVFNHAAGHNALIEQRNEFSNDKLTERTFPLLRVTSRDFNLAVLAVHTNSGSNPEDLGDRQRAVAKIASLHKTLQAQNTPLLVIGDMNTMGNGSSNFTPTRERTITANMLAAAGLSRLKKNRPHTWHGVGPDKIYPDTDLDHAFLTTASAQAARLVNTKGEQVRVSGWPDRKTGPQRDHWVRRYSDHAYLVVDIKPKLS